MGFALVKRFLNEGWRVYCVVRKKADAIRMTDINSEHCIPIISDVTSDKIQSDIATSLSKSTTIDVLINNAGAGGIGVSLADTSAADAGSLFNVHCLGPLRVTQAIIPFIKDNGIIINISSRFGSITKMATGALDHIPCSYSYRIAKAAQNMFTQCLIREYKNSSLKICAVHPGKLKTTTASLDADKSPSEAVQKIFALLNKIEDGKFYSLFEGEIAW